MSSALQPPLQPPERQTLRSQMPFGQLVIGSPGSGKTTYCHGLYQFLHALNRPISIVNLDPANGLSLPYPCAINIASLITVKDVMKELGLGPNGAMLYCMEYLEENLSWLESQLDELSDDAYVAFDLPGQVELSTNHGSLRRILDRLAKRDWRLVAVHLMDASHITDASRYVSLLLLSLRAMLTLELPHVNVLSKVDLLGEAAETKGSDEGSSLSDDDEDDAEVRKKAGGLGEWLPGRDSCTTAHTTAPFSIQLGLLHRGAGPLLPHGPPPIIAGTAEVVSLLGTE